MAKNCIIYETMQDVKSMAVKKTADGLMHLSGVFGVCGVMNSNKRVYNKDNYAEMVKRLQETINTEGCPGELEHPDSMNINLANVSHKIDSISIDENGVVSGEITLLNTPNGKIAQAIVEGGLPLFISSRARGIVGQGGAVTLDELKTYDLVGSAGFSQAKMHLAEGRIAEQLNESMFCVFDKENVNESNNQEDMENKELLEKVQALESKVAELEKRPDEKAIAEGVQNWIVNEFSPELEKWVNENVGTGADTKNLADAIQGWIMNEYAPELTESITAAAETKTQEWVIEKYSDIIQKWITDHYSEEVQNWVTNECANDMQKWMFDEFAPQVDKWVSEQYTPEIQKWIVEKFSPVIDEWVKNEIKESKKTTLDSIDETLAILEGASEKKPKYGRKQIMNEGASEEPKFIREMPEEARVKWNLASEEVKESIKRRAKVYNFVNEASIDAFWSTINFEEVKPATSVYEGLENIQDDREKMYRASLRKFTSRF